MRKYLLGIFAALLLASPAAADFTGKNAAGSTVTFKNPGDCTSVVCVPMSQPYDGTNTITFTTAGGDAVSNTLTGMPVYARLSRYNGTTWDRWTGAVTIASGGVASGAYASGSIAAGAIVDGASVVDGATADAVVAAGAAGSHSAKFRRMTTDLGTIATNTTGVATAANQTTGNGFLSTIATNSAGANPVNVNTVVTAQTGLTPGVSQTGTIIAANQDVSSIKGTATAVNTGNADAGTQRVVLASNQPIVPTTPAAGTANGATPSVVIAAASNNSTSLKGSAGTVYAVQTGNINASTPYYLKFYDKATAPTCGTDTPVTVLIVPPSNSGNNVNVPVGKAFTLGIGYCIVTGIANNDNTSVPAATIIANIDYK